MKHAPRTHRIAPVVLASPLLPAPSFAQIPALINDQERLINGTNLVNGSVGLSLRLYNVDRGGTVLFEDSNTVSVVDGLYSTLIGDNVNSEILGALTLPEVLTNPGVYLETAVNGVTLSPRERMVSVAYALRAEHDGSVQPPIDITDFYFPDSVLRIANNGGDPGAGEGEGVRFLRTDFLAGRGESCTARGVGRDQAEAWHVEEMVNGWRRKRTSSFSSKMT